MTETATGVKASIGRPTKVTPGDGGGSEDGKRKEAGGRGRSKVFVNPDGSRSSFRRGASDKRVKRTELLQEDGEEEINTCPMGDEGEYRDTNLLGSDTHRRAAATSSSSSTVASAARAESSSSSNSSSEDSDSEEEEEEKEQTPPPKVADVVPPKTATKRTTVASKEPRQSIVEASNATPPQQTKRGPGRPKATVSVV